MFLKIMVLVFLVLACDLNLWNSGMGRIHALARVHGHAAAHHDA